MNYKQILTMNAIESMYYLSNLKYLGIFDYIEVTVSMIKRNQAIYRSIVFFSKRYIISYVIVIENYK